MYKAMMSELECIMLLTANHPLTASRPGPINSLVHIRWSISLLAKRTVPRKLSDANRGLLE